MDVSNETPYDAKYKVAGGGTPMGPHGHFFPTEEAAHWPVIPAGAVIKHPMGSHGPWRIYFLVNGHGIIVEASSDNDRVDLVHTGADFRAKVQKASHAKTA
ncbi:MAG: hypothetical protein QOF89_4167 [Acidobacteriota bacterium]|nr:hypothetical protein [Acidobacteriota bacterium]